MPYGQLVIQGRLNGAGLFDFDPQAHEPGTLTVLGQSYAQTGADQGEAVLRRLADHPATAQFVATKLARHFVSDDPPQQVVQRLAGVFLATAGDLAKVSASLVDSPEAFARPLQKFKAPQEFLVSAVRAFPEIAMDATTLQRTIAGMGQVPYTPPGPNGWPDIAGEWLGADAIWKRLAWANEVTQTGAVAQARPLERSAQVLGEAMSDATRTAIERAQSPAQGLILLLASADFQRR